jgi:uncharacterized protein YecT (DUF1311 family)
MAGLTNCKTCGKEVAKSAQSCPHCGQKLKSGVLAKIFLVILGFVFIPFLFSSLPKEQRATQNAEQRGNSSSSPSSSAPSVAAQLPPHEVEFIRIVSEAQVKARQAANDMQKGGIKAERDKAICELMKTNSVSNWIGTVASIDANSDGKGVLEVRIADNIFVQTWNNDLSDMLDHTLLEPGSAIFTAASAMKRGQEVTFSGSFAAGLNEGECIGEQSVTLDGKLRKPEFTIRFSEIAPLTLKKEDKKAQAHDIAVNFIKRMERGPYPKKEIEVIRMCAEPGEFDFKAFKAMNNIHTDNESRYPIWEIAEEASRGGRLGKPDPELVLHLVCQEEDGALAEQDLAVREAYTNWKNRTAKEFNICDHITSGYGAGFCAQREHAKDEKEREEKLKELRQRLGQNSINLLDDAYKSAVEFIELKAGGEEGHGGSWVGTWVINSETKQKNEYVQLIKKIHDGYTPSSKNAFSESDEQLNKTYQKVLKLLSGSDQEALKSLDPPSKGTPTPDDIRAVQRLWITYRDASAKLFMTINPSIGESVYKSWLTEIRSKELECILKTGSSLIEADKCYLDRG